MNVRELRVTDIRCACGAGPGEYCQQALVNGVARRWYSDGGGIAHVHLTRREEFEALRLAGWLWQEVDPRDNGATR
jgi:hypothetical protein